MAFHPFLRLPAEIRILIYSAALCRPSLIHIVINGNSEKGAQVELRSSLLHAFQEARRYCLRTLKPIHIGGRTIYFSPDIDFLLFGGCCTLHSSEGGMELGTFLEDPINLTMAAHHIRNLSVHYYSFFGDAPLLIGCLLRFTSLTKLVIFSNRVTYSADLAEIGGVILPLVKKLLEAEKIRYPKWGVETWGGGTWFEDLGMVIHYS